MEDLSWQHRIRATTEISVAEFADKLDASETPIIFQKDDRVMIETQGELSPVLKWLADMPLRNVTIEPVGLRSVYDRIHRTEEVATESKESEPVS